MKIIKKGMRPTKLDIRNHKIYGAKCKNCRCIFQYEYREVHEHIDYGVFEDYKSICCPYCGEEMLHHFYNRKRKENLKEEK